MAVPRCRLCHRILKDSESIARGFGPVCWERVCSRKKKNPAAPNGTGKSVTNYGTKKGDGQTISLEEWIKAREEGDDIDPGTDPGA